jgi:hypothetical protein
MIKRTQWRISSYANQDEPTNNPSHAAAII